MTASECVVALEGEIDMSVRAEVTAALRAAALEGSGPVVVDLSAVTFMDSSGLSAIADLVGAVDGRAVHLRGPRPPVLRVLELCGLDQVTTID